LASGVSSDRRRHTALVFILISCLYFLAASGFAATTPFWYDELFSVTIARLPRIGDIIAALSQGADHTPPAIFILTRLANRLPGNELITNRLPGLIGFWLMGVCTFIYVRRRLPAPCAWVAAALPAVTAIYTIAREARPYGLLAGLCGIALVCWQAAADGRRRMLALTGLTISLSLAILSHYYAVFLFLPFAVAELVRWLARRRVDREIAMSLALAACTELVLLPMVRATSSLAGGFSLKVSPSAALDVYVFFVDKSSAIKLLIAVCLIAPFVEPLAAALRRRLSLGGRILEAPGPMGAPDVIPPHEYAGALVLAAMPFVQVLVTGALHAPFSFRYGIYAIVGISVLAAYALGWMSTRVPTAAWSVAVLIVAVAGVRLGLGIPLLFRAPPAWNRDHPLLAEAPSTQSIVIERAADFLPLSYYAPPGVRQRFAYLADAEASLRVLGRNSADVNLLALARWAPVPVRPYAEYVRGQERFLVYSSHDGWLLEQLLADGAEVRLVKASGATALYQVSGLDGWRR
jgi:hypothetical protein